MFILTDNWLLGGLGRFVGFCRFLSVYVGFCRPLSAFVGFCRLLSAFVGWSAFVGFCRFLSDGRLLSGSSAFVGNGRLWSAFVGFCRIWSAFVGFLVGFCRHLSVSGVGGGLFDLFGRMSHRRLSLGMISLYTK